MKEIKIIGEDDYEYNIDEIEMVIIKNKLGSKFEFKPEEIKSIELITTEETVIEPDTNDPSQFPADGNDLI